jgi:DNA-directed RNA polymerase sigma subunit (sigma70/sigma32)
MTKNGKQYMLTRDTLSLDALMENGDSPLLDGFGCSKPDLVEDEVFRSLCIKEIHDGLALLPKAQRDVLDMIFGLGGCDKRSLQEIAWKFGKNSSWVMITARHALSHLRAVLGRRLEGYLEIAA